MYGTFVPHLSSKNDKYGFIDENEIRIATGITLVLSLFSMFLVVFKGEFDIPLILVSIMVVDFLIKVLVQPRYSIFGSLVRLTLRKREPLWVGAVQKRFAWSIGVVLASFVLLCLLILGGYLMTEDPMIEAVRLQILDNIISGTMIITPMNPAIIACLLCIIFMWLESVVGYCVGCHIYAWLVRKGWMKEVKGQNCVNGVCEIK